MMKPEKVFKVLIVDDSALIRSSLKEVISSFPEFTVIGTAADPYIAAHKMKDEKPDVITLDIQMPKMDGITFLRKIMTQHPIPIVVVSSLTSKDSETALEAYKYGAINVLEKPVFISELKHDEWKDYFHETLLTAANSIIDKNKFKSAFDTISKVEKTTTINEPRKSCNSLVMIGASAGGTEVINSILSNLDQNTAPILLVQHMPQQFTKAFASRLNNNSKMLVKQAESGDILERGKALLAPGDQHMELRNNGFDYFVKLTEDEKVNRHRPSVDVLFISAEKFSGTKKMAIILSGMGKDGAEGLLKLKNNGAITIAQDQNSCIVYGMPKEAVRIGAASYSMDIEQIVKTIKDFSEINL